MATAQSLLRLARQHVGEHYVLGAMVEFTGRRGGYWLRLEGVAFGNFALVDAFALERYREERSLEGIKTILVEQGYYADLVVFDPDRIEDHATFDEPHRYATGVSDVVVNGTLALRDGEPTGALPGRVVRGPGWDLR